MVGLQAESVPGVRWPQLEVFQRRIFAREKLASGGLRPERTQLQNRLGSSSFFKNGNKMSKFPRNFRFGLLGQLAL